MKEFFSKKIIEEIKSLESSPKVIKNCFSNEEIETLINIENSSKYLVDRVDGRKAGLGKDGSIAEKNMENWRPEIKAILIEKMREILGDFKISETEFPPHFFTVNFPTRIHADTGKDPNAQIYKQIMIPLQILPAGSRSHTILFKNRWYGPATFFVGKDCEGEEKNNQGHLKAVSYTHLTLPTILLV